ncbi:MAG: ATP-binding protein [Bacillota bacterium]|nr:ATP-binding protein [Bacillota bacterium]
MKKKLSLLNCLLLVLSIGLVFSLGVYFAQRAILTQAEDSLISLTSAYSYGYRDDLSTITTDNPNIRLTIIDSAGNVIYDSEEDPSTMENHLQRVEIQNALNGNEDEAVYRVSQTLGEELLYYAEKVDSSLDSAGYRFLRVSMRLSSVQSYLLSYLPYLALISLLALGASIGLSIYFSNRLLSPFYGLAGELESLNRGEYKKKSLPKDPEVRKIVSEIDAAAEKLSENLLSQRRQQAELTLLIDSLSDGLVAYSKEGKLTLINKKAASIFEIEGKIVGEPLYKLGGDEYLEKKLSSGEGEFDFSYRGRVYLCRVNELEGSSLLVMTDVTSDRQSAMNRKQFFDAASHELKTPLTSILGFSELASLSPEKGGEYASQINKEAKRMYSLVQDMLTLSELEKSEPKPAEEIAISKIAEEVVGELSPLAEERKISVSYKGECHLKIDERDAYALLKNLVENAIKYNHEGGHVYIRLNKDGFSVKDDGFGISEKDQPYVFERFYRVDKSRSRQNGGTGLGLAIVKHLCAIYKLRLSLFSKLGQGTTIKVGVSKS